MESCTHRKSQFQNEETRACSMRIDELNQKSEDGSFKFKRDEDILTMDLGTRENSGRVRGVGIFVTLSVYFQSRAQAKEDNRDKMMNVMRQMIEDQNKKISTLKALLSAVPSPYTSGSDKVSCSYKVSKEETREGKKPCIEFAKKEPSKEVTREDQGLSCNLALGTMENIVATGRKLDNTNEVTPGYVWVIIDIVMDENARLPNSPHDDLVLVVDAIGLEVEWPAQFVIPMKNNKKVSSLAID